MRRFHISIILSLSAVSIVAQTEGSKQKTLTLERAIKIATDSSLNAFMAKNMYLSDYWQYRSYKANRLPSLTLGATPMQYNHTFVQRYDSENNIDVYKSQQSIYSSANLSLTQNVDLTGGTFFIDTDLSYLSSFGADKREQYSSVPIRVGYSQKLFGYNEFKWNRILEPLRFEKAKKELAYKMEEIAETTTGYFFNHVLNQTLYDLAYSNMLNSDTLYQIGCERQKIGSITEADLLTLRLNALNAKDDLKEAAINLKKSAIVLSSFLRDEETASLHLVIPEKISDIIIPESEALILARDNNPKIPQMKEQILTAEQKLDRMKKEQRFSASVTASVGFNQVANNLVGAYEKPLRQDLVSVTMTIPIVDWGVRKGRVNMAKSELNTSRLSASQAEQEFEQNIMITVNEFNMRYSQIISAREAKKIADLAYEAMKQRFLIGKTDVNNLNISLSNKTSAQRNYILSLRNYWEGYYNIRKQTLYDFMARRPLTVEYEGMKDIK